MRRLWFVGLILIIASAAAWYRYSPLSVVVLAPTRGSAVEAIYATGLVEPSVLLPIAPRVAGHLRELNVIEGQAVHKGEIIAQFEALDMVQSVDEQAARALYAKQQQERAATLAAKGFYSGAELDRATAEAFATQAALRRAKALQGFTILRAPADGMVLRRDAEVGQFIAAGQVIMSLACCAPLRVSAEVDEEDIADVKIGQKVVLRAPAFPKHVFIGQVSSITPKGDPVSRSYRVRISLNKPEQLRVGMTVEANLITQEKSNVLLIPSQVIQNGQVWVLEKGKLRQRAVQLGIVGSERSELLAGMDAHSQIVWPLPKGIRNGRSGQVVMASATAASTP